MPLSASLPQNAPAPAHPFDSEHWRAFAKEIDAIGKDTRSANAEAGYRQFLKMELWGRCATLLGYATAWIAPNPLSAFLISQGNYTRWAVVQHQVSHGAFDRCDFVPAKHKSRNFAQGARRFLDWFDWITPRNWDDEHNRLHHYHLGAPKDPDVVGRNAAYIRSVGGPAWLRYFLAFVMACLWKPVYYAVNTLAESRYLHGSLKTNKLGWNNWSPLTSEGRELWLTCLLPYAAFRFVFLPALFLPLGQAACVNVLLNSIFAELLTNFYSFSTIGPNHTGDDLYTFAESPRNKAEHYFRQIVGTVNYPAGGDLADFLYGGMNYQIEHHLWPEASLLQCRNARHQLKQVCGKYGVPYKEAPLLPRLAQTFGIMAGTRNQRDLQAEEIPA